MAGSLSGIFDSTKKIIVVAGHYGTGKTNVAVNLALAYAAMGERTVIADIDIVNPYFRTADAATHLISAGVECIIPEYANSNVDLPTLPPQLYSRCADAARGEDVRIILDVGIGFGKTRADDRRLIEEIGTPEEVFDNPKSEKTRSFIRGTQEAF